MKILVVDDEALIRESIAQTLVDMACFEVHMANNGQAALDMVRECEYDAIILDIMMPRINGIELLQQLNSISRPMIKIVISGYDKFGFAQKAIEYGVSEFLLKPIPRKGVQGLGERLRATIEKNRLAQQEMVELKALVESSKPILLERFLEEMVVFGACSVELDRQLEYCGLRFIGEYFQVATLHYKINGEVQEELEQQALAMKLSRAAISHSQEELQITGCRTVDSNVVLVFCMKNLIFAPLVELKLAAIIELVDGLLMSVRGGLGHIVHGTRGLHNSYVQAQGAAKYNALITDLPFIHIHDIENVEESVLDEIDYENMRSQIRLGFNEQALDSLREYFASPGVGSLLSVQIVAMKVLTACMSVLSELKLEIGECVAAAMAVARGEARGGSAYETLYALITHTAREVERARNEKSSYIVERVQQHIAEHYHEDNSIKEIADNLYVSKNYLGQQFKEKMGLSISNYANNLRIKKAMELLSLTNLKVYEIGNKVGFDDQHYFSAIFKKYTGVSPSEYRELAK